jgi:hypothetical protein
MPKVAAAGGRSLIAWQGDDAIDRRLLKQDGTFATGIATLGPHLGSFDRFDVAASPSAFALVARTGVDLGSPKVPRVTIVNRTTGSEVRVLEADPEQAPWRGADIVYDGQNFVVGHYGEPGDPRFQGAASVRVVAADLKSIGDPTYTWWLHFEDGLRIGGANGRDLIVGARDNYLTSARVT